MNIKIGARFDLDPKNKEEAIRIAIDKRFVSSSEKLLEEVLKREEMASTDVGNKILIPHARSKWVKESFLSFLRLKNEIDGTKYIFLIGAKENEGREYMKILTLVARSLLLESFVSTFETLKSEADFIKALEDTIEKVKKE